MHPRYLLLKIFGSLIEEAICLPFDRFEDAEAHLRSCDPPDEDLGYAILVWDENHWRFHESYTEFYCNNVDESRTLWPGAERCEG